MDRSAAGARGENRTGLIWAMDTCLLIDLDEGQAHAVELDRLDEAGWIDLVKMDVLDTELGRNWDAAQLALRLVRSATFVEYFGPMVLDYSRLEHTVRASQEDVQLLERVFRILWPKSRMDTANHHQIGDAMHVAWSIRNRTNGFVTSDQRVLERRAAIEQVAHDGFRINSPDEALDCAQREVRKYEQWMDRLVRSQQGRVNPPRLDCS
jgi:hypothetical protein